MKKMQFLMSVLATVAMGLTGVSCSSDSSSSSESGGGNLSTPAYEDVSAKYVSTSSTSAYKSIELTASGNYIAIARTSAYSAPATPAPTAEGSLASRAASKMAAEVMKSSFALNNAVAATRADEATATTINGITTGRFNKKGEGQYELVGLGTLNVNTVGENNYQLDLALEDGTSLSMNATKAQTYDSELTSKLCRTWLISNFYMKFTYEGIEVLNGTYGPNDLTKMATDMANKLWSAYRNQFLSEFQKEEGRAMTSTEEAAFKKELAAEMEKSLSGFFQAMPKTIIFSKSSTYFVDYLNIQQRFVANWSWRSEEEKTIDYSYSNVSGYATLDFSGATLKLDETTVRNQSGIVLTWNLREQK